MLALGGQVGGRRLCKPSATWLDRRRCGCLLVRRRPICALHFVLFHQITTKYGHSELARRQYAPDYVMPVSPWPRDSDLSSQPVDRYAGIAPSPSNAISPLAYMNAALSWSGRAPCQRLLLGIMTGNPTVAMPCAV